MAVLKLNGKTYGSNTLLNENYKPDGVYIDGYPVLKFGETIEVNKDIKLTSNNGAITVSRTGIDEAIGLHVAASENKGLYDTTNDKWIIYKQKTDGTIHFIDETVSENNFILNSNKSIQYIGTGGRRNMIQFKNGGDAFGDSIVIGGGGATIIGGGESADTVYPNIANNNESMIIANDGAIDFYANCQNGYSSRQAFSMTANGTITTPKGTCMTSNAGVVGMGSYAITANTVQNAIQEIRYKNGCIGSVNITTAFTANGFTVSAQWYTYLWLPHRTGGTGTAADGDNSNYGSLFLVPMTTRANVFYIVTFRSGSTYELSRYVSA